MERLDDEQAEARAEAPQEPTEAPQEPTDGKANREAAKYRKALRETEAERDSLKERLKHSERFMVERLADFADMHDHGDEFWRMFEIDSFRDEDGRLVPDKIDQALIRFRKERAHLLGAAKRVRFSTGEPTRGVPKDDSVTWADAIKGGKK
jgi:hypothetical protein